MTSSEARELLIALYESQSQPIFRYCAWMLRDVDEAQDALQDIYLRAAGGIGNLRERDFAKTWLWSIAHRHLMDRLRQRQRERRRTGNTSVLDGFAARTTDPAEALILAESMEVLAPDERELIVLRFLRELSAQEVGVILGCTAGHVRVMTHRALRKLRDDNE